MMNPYKQRLAFQLWFLGFRPFSVLQSHLPSFYLRISVEIYLETMTSTWGLGMMISLEGTTCLSRLGRVSLASFALDLVAFRLSSNLSLCDLTDA